MSGPEKEVIKVEREIERVQTGVRMEIKLFQVLKGLAAYRRQSLGELLESLVRRALLAEPGFDARSLEKARALMAVYDLPPVLSSEEISALYREERSALAAAESVIHSEPARKLAAKRAREKAD